MSENKVKPATIEKGQRFCAPDEGACLTIVEANWSIDPQLSYVQWDGMEPGGVVSHADLLTWRFLGYDPGYGPPETPEAPKPAKGQRWRDTGSTDFPVSGVFSIVVEYLTIGWGITGGSGRTWVPHEWFTNGRLEFVDNGTPEAPGVVVGEDPSCVDCSVSLEKRVRIAVRGGGWRCVPCGAKFNAASRRLPRSQQRSAPVPEAPPAPGIVEAKKAQWRRERNLEEQLRPRGRMVGEARALDGTPLSRLQVVPCRRSSEQFKPVEPWVPSCDIDCDIPDAPGFNTRPVR